MSDLKFNFEWIDPEGAIGAELRATWARFQLLVDGESITRPLDNVSKTVRDSVFLPVYPLAEWLVTHWWFLLNEIESPRKTNEETYQLRHDLHQAGEGFATPPATFKPLGDLVLIDWRQEEFPLQRIEFVGEGTAHVTLENFVTATSQFISSVVGRLTELGIADSLLQQEWKAIQEASVEERTFCEACGALGIDPYNISEATSNTIVRVGNELPQSLVGEFFRAADLPRLNEQFRNVVEALKLSRENPVNLVPIKDLRQITQASVKVAGAPWDQGYQVARQLRHELGLNGAVLRSLDDVSRALRVSNEDLNAAINRKLDQSYTFDAVVDVNSAGSPGFVISHKREESLKFSFCRGLFEFLYANENEPLLVTKTRSDRQKRNRAFASEFLLPAESLRHRVSTSYVDEEEIEDLATDYGVSMWVVEHQLQNHHIAKVINS